jgi:hypothetical protein
MDPRLGSVLINGLPEVKRTLKMTLEMGSDHSQKHAECRTTFIIFALLNIYKKITINSKTTEHILLFVHYLVC